MQRTQMLSVTRHLTLEVDADFCDVWLEHGATPAARTAALRLVCSLPRSLEEDERAKVAVLSGEVVDAATARLAEAVRIAHDAARAPALASELEALREEVAVARQSAAAAEHELATQLRQQLAQTARYSEEREQLLTRVTALERPMGRGRAGELDVAEAMGDLGFAVEDTSTGDARARGHLDLLAVGRDGARIAVECKNVSTIERKAHLDVFDRKVATGLATDLFDAAIFVSLRAHTKHDDLAQLRMAKDAHGRDLVPVSYIGPPRGHEVPLSREQLEGHVCLHAALLAQCRGIARSLGDRGASAREAALIHSLAHSTANDLGGVLDDMSRQLKLITDMRGIVIAAKARCLHALHATWSAGEAVSWLHTPVAAPWLATYQQAVDQERDAVSLTSLWAGLPARQRAALDKAVGKDAVFAALKELKRSRDAP